MLEMYFASDPLTGLQKSNPSKLLKLEMAADCMHAYAIAQVNKIRKEEVAKMSAAEHASRKGTMKEISD